MIVNHNCIVDNIVVCYYCYSYDGQIYNLPL